MDSQALSKDISKIKSTNPEIASILSQICEQLEDKDKKIETLQNECTDLRNRVLKLERYNSKDCVIISNFPFRDDGIPLTEQAVNFFNNVFNANIVCPSVKACHFLGNPRAQHPKIIVKFVYFEDKNYIWRAKKLLHGMMNNGQYIYMNERLPENDSKVHMYANKELKLKTVTDNCAVKVEVKNASGGSGFVEVRSKDDVDKLQARAVSKFSNVNIRPSINQHSSETPVPQMQRKPRPFIPQTPCTTSMPDLKRGRPLISDGKGELENQLIKELKARKDNKEDMLDFIMGYIGDTPVAKQPNVDSEMPFHGENPEESNE